MGAKRTWLPSEPLRKDLRYVVRRRPDGATSKMSVAGSGLHLRVPEQLADHR